MTRPEVVAYIDLLGKRFEYGACGPDAYDCKGLMVELFKRRGISFPHYDSSDSPAVQSERFAEGLSQYAVKIETLEPGCMVMFRIVPPYVSHVGMMIDKLNFIHITRHSRVSVERIDSLQWKNKIAGYYRLNHG